MAKKKAETAHPLLTALDRAEPRPDPRADRADKKNYAERLSRELARVVADALRGEYPRITPTAQGLEQESPTGGDGGKKRLDVKVWDDRSGLVLSVSIKTYSFQDYSTKNDKLGRFTKNILRNDHELRAEADVIHRRQPYSVLIGLVFMNEAAAHDAVGPKGQSSFVHAVATLRKRQGRTGPDDSRYDRFERVYIGLCTHDGADRGAVSFFDTRDSPLRVGLPRRLLSLADLVEEIVGEVDRRNHKSKIYEDDEVVSEEELESLELPEDDDD